MPHQDLQKILQDLQQVTAQPAVSIFVKTHRTFPDNAKDPIALKNQLRIAEEHLKARYDEATTQQIFQHIQRETQALDPNYNLDTLAIFATKDQAQVYRFPFDSPERVVINSRFAVRDIVRDLVSAVHYYAVVVTREKGRLIEAINDRVIHEFSPEDTSTLEILPSGFFPMASDNLTATTVDERHGTEDNYIKEFMNRIDKNAQAMRGRRPLPLIIVGDKRNIGFYQEVCDQPQSIIATVDNVTHLDNAEPQHIIDSIQPALKDYQQQQQSKAFENIRELRGTPRFRSDLQEIYRAALDGNTDVLYVCQGHSQPGQLNEQQRTLNLDHTSNEHGNQNDLIDDLIELVRKNSGQVIFMEPSYMDNNEPVVLQTRYAQ